MRCHNIFFYNKISLLIVSIKCIYYSFLVPRVSNKNHLMQSKYLCRMVFPIYNIGYFLGYYNVTIQWRLIWFIWDADRVYWYWLNYCYFLSISNIYLFIAICISNSTYLSHISFSFSTYSFYTTSQRKYAVDEYC